MSEKSERLAAIKKIKEASDVALEDLKESKKVAKQTIDDACQVAVNALENTSRIPDKRNLDGSFQWDRGDRYRRGSDEKIQRLEDKINGERGQISTLEAGQARREEQIQGLRNECLGLRSELDTKKAEIEHLGNELTADMKELSSRIATVHDLITQVKEGADDKLDALRDASSRDKIKNQQYVIGIVVGLIVTFLSSVVFAYFRV